MDLKQILKTRTFLYIGGALTATVITAAAIYFVQGSQLQGLGKMDAGGGGDDSPVPKVDCSGTPNPVEEGGKVTWKATVSNVNGVTYSWSGPGVSGKKGVKVTSEAYKSGTKSPIEVTVTATAKDEVGKKTCPGVTFKAAPKKENPPKEEPPKDNEEDDDKEDKGVVIYNPNDFANGKVGTLNQQKMETKEKENPPPKKSPTLDCSGSIVKQNDGKIKVKWTANPKDIQPGMTISWSGTNIDNTQYVTQVSPEVTYDAKFGSASATATIKDKSKKELYSKSCGTITFPQKEDPPPPPKTPIIEVKTPLQYDDRMVFPYILSNSSGNTEITAGIFDDTKYIQYLWPKKYEKDGSHHFTWYYPKSGGFFFVIWGKDGKIDMPDQEKFFTVKKDPHPPPAKTPIIEEQTPPPPPGTPALSCTADKSEADIGETITYNATVDGVDDPALVKYYWDWDSDGKGDKNDVFDNQGEGTNEKSFDSEGLKKVQIFIDDLKYGDEIIEKCDPIYIKKAGDTPPPDEEDLPPDDLPPDDTPPDEDPPPAPPKEEIPLLPAEEILNCKGDGDNIALSKKESVASICTLKKVAFINAMIIKGDYTPGQQPNKQNIVKYLMKNSKLTAKPFVLVWDTLNTFDQQVQPGQYSFVISAATNSKYEPDYSIYQFKVVQNPVGQPQQKNENQQPEEPAKGPANKPIAQSPQPTPNAEAPAPVPSKCQGVNYPQDINNHWAKDFIKLLVDKCLIKGFPDGSFKPDQQASKIEALIMIMSGANYEPKKGCYTANCGAGYPDHLYKDINNFDHGAWLRTAWEKKVVKAAPKDLFKPYDKITRAQAAAMVAKAFRFGYKKGCYTANCGAGQPDNIYTDIKVPWQGAYIRVLSDEGIVSGKASHQFKPEDPITRAELAKIIYYARVVKGLK